MQRSTRYFGAAMAAMFIGGITLTPVAAHASEEGRRNTTLGLGALTGYLFTRGGSKVPAFIGLAGTAYAYKRYNDSISARHAREKRMREYYRSRAARLKAYRAKRHHAAHHHRW